MKFEGIVQINFKILLAALLIIAAVTSTSVCFASDYGIDKDVKTGILNQARARVSYDAANNEAAIKSPGSILAMTCVDKAAVAETKVVGELFSGKFTKGVKNTLENDLKTHFQKFSWDHVFSYTTEIKADLSLGMEGGVTIGVANSKGPVVKNFSCDNATKIWERRKDSPTATPAFIESVEKLLNSGASSTSQQPDTASSTPTPEEQSRAKFDKVWSSDSNSKDDLQHRNDSADKVNNKANDMDVFYEGNEDDPCKVLEKMGMSGCSK